MRSRCARDWQVLLCAAVTAIELQACSVPSKNRPLQVSYSEKHFVAIEGRARNDKDCAVLAVGEYPYRLTELPAWPAEALGKRVLVHGDLSFMTISGTRDPLDQVLDDRPWAVLTSCQWVVLGSAL